jgi:glycosyltransferase involved in cell wall biosynthesis
MPPDLADAAEPCCTVAIPVYNRRTMVLRALASVLEQPLPGLDVLVVDNCSDDGTWEALQTIDDPRLRLARNARNVGLFGNFNRCLELARGRYLRFLCSDDVLAPGCLTDEVAAMNAQPSVVLLSSMARRVGADGTVLGSHADHVPPGVYAGRTAIAGVLQYKADYGYNPLNYPSGVLLRTEAVRRAGRFDTTMRMAADVDLFLRVLGEGDLLVTEHRGCDVTIHPNQEGARLAGNADVMREEFLLLERFGAAIASPPTRRRVAQSLGGFCLHFAVRDWARGDWASARAHIAVGREHGCKTPGMAAALARIAARRILLKALGVRLLPSGFDSGRRERERARLEAPSALRETHASGDAKGA